MIQTLHHLAIIVSSENGVDFYKKLGFCEISRIDRSYDILVYLEGYGMVLEIYIDATHPKRPNKPEALGLRHFALKTDNLEVTLKMLDVEAEPIRIVNGKKYTFLKDPDGLPIELHE